MPKIKEPIKVPQALDTTPQGRWGEWVAKAEFQDFQRRYNPPNSAKSVLSGENVNFSPRNVSSATTSSELPQDEERSAFDVENPDSSCTLKSNLILGASEQAESCEVSLQEITVDNGAKIPPPSMKHEHPPSSAIESDISDKHLEHKASTSDIQTYDPAIVELKVFKSAPKSTAACPVPPHLRGLGDKGSLDGVDPENSTLISKESYASVVAKQSVEARLAQAIPVTFNEDIDLERGWLRPKYPGPFAKPDPEVVAARKELVRAHMATFLPPNLQNVPRPIFLKKEEPESKGKKPIETPQPIQSTGNDTEKRNLATKGGAFNLVEEFFPDHVIDLEPISSIGIEYATSECALENMELADDNSVSSNILQIEDGLKKYRLDHPMKPSRWRWFNDIPTDKLLEKYNKGVGNNLIGFDGKFVPPPLDWDEREQFNSESPEHIKVMDKWLRGRVTEALTCPYMLDTTTEGFLNGANPTAGTRRNYQSYPPDCLVKQRWLAYQPVPWDEIPTLPPKDPYSSVEGRCAQTSKLAAKKYRKEARIAEQLAKEQKLVVEQKIDPPILPQTYVAPENEFTPQINIYIRPAQDSDIPQLTGLYNYYVDYTVKAPELVGISEAWMKAHMEAVEEARLSFLVAVLKNSKGLLGDLANDLHMDKGKWFKRDHQNRIRRTRGAKKIAGRGRIQEKIVGFAYANTCGGQESIWKWAVQLETFVDPDYSRLGIGKNLLDRLMVTVDPAHSCRYATDFFAETGSFGSAANREIKKAIVQLYWNPGHEQEFIWQREFLENEFYFDHVGTMPTVAEKFGKPINVAIMMRETNKHYNRSLWYPGERNRYPRLVRGLDECEDVHHLAKPSD